MSALLIRFLILCVSLLCSLSIPYSMDQDPTLAFSHHLTTIGDRGNISHALSLLRLCKAAQNTKRFKR